METENLSFDHAMQRAVTIFGSQEARATVIAGCVQSAMHNQVHPEGLAPVDVVARHAKKLFIEVVEAFTPEQSLQFGNRD